MAALVTLDQAKADLGILDDTSRDAEVTSKINAAHGIVMKHIKFIDLDALQAEDVDGIRAAEWLVLRSLFFGETENPLSEAVKALLSGYRDPTLA